MNEITRRKIDANALCSGLVLIAIGLLFLLDRFGFVSFGYVISHWWPMFIAGFGVSHLLKGHVWTGAWMIGLALWFELIRYRVFGLSFSSGWPLILIAVGAGTILRALFDSARRSEPSSPENHRGA